MAEPEEGTSQTGAGRTGTEHAGPERERSGREVSESAGSGRDVSFWRSRTQISLQPISAPSILGLFGNAAATFIVASNLAGWYGTQATPLILFPFAMVFGGLAQFLAGMWSFRARDGLATAVHGMWGSFWLSYGFYYLLVALRELPTPAVSPIVQVSLGQWFIVLAAITWVGALGAFAENLALTAVLTALAAGATLLAIGWTASVGVLVPIAGIVLVISAVLAFYTATALMLHGTYGHAVLPVGRRRVASVPSQPIQYELGEPGVKIGQ